MSKAIGFEGDVDNIKTYAKINSIGRRSKAAVRLTWFSLGKELHQEADKEIKRKPKGGRTYFIRVGGTRIRRHVASAAGETHANLSGALRRSISWKVHGSKRLDFGYGFSTTASNKAPEYDSFVEDGTSKMDPRPSIENAVMKIKNSTDNHFKREMLKQMKRA